MKIEPKDGPEGIGCLGPLKKTITSVRGLQLLSPSRILLYYQGASFNISLSNPFNETLFVINISRHIRTYTQRKILQCVTGLKGKSLYSADNNNL